MIAERSWSVPKRERCDAGSVPTAWVVLEELVARAVETDENFRASLSVRSLASELALSNGRTAQALICLREVGIVTAVQSRTAAGTFTAGHYVIAFPDGLSPVCDSADASRSLLSSAARRRTSPRGHAQLALPIDF